MHGIHNLHKEDIPPKKECLIQVFILIFVTKNRPQIIMKKGVSESCKLHLMLLVCARLQASDFGNGI